MNIGIIVHSKSGNTYAAAQKLQQKLSTAGHKVTIERLNPIGDAHPGIKNLQLEKSPKINEYEGLIFAAPVWAFAVSPVMATYMEQLSSLQGKKIGSFVTMGFPLPWLGGNRAIKQIKEKCESKGGTVSASAIIGSSGKDKKATNEMIDTIGGIFK